MGGGLSLWLAPHEPDRARLEALIRELASRQRTPTFRAHLTLLGGLRRDEKDALERTEELARRTPAVSMKVAQAAHEAAYYRCVFLEVAATPELLGAHQRARRAMGGGPDRFHPHVSLVYGRLDEHTRQELAQQAERALELPQVMAARWLELHETRGAPSGWRLCGSFPLGG